jgi:hypothetical protein
MLIFHIHESTQIIAFKDVIIVTTENIYTYVSTYFRKMVFESVTNNFILLMR